MAAAAAAILVAPVLLSTATRDGSQRTRLAEAYGRVPLAFEANEGQTDPEVAFLARGTGYALFLTPGEAVLSLRPNPPTGKPAGPNRRQASETPRVVLRLKCHGANPSPRLRGLDPQTARSNYFVGNDPSRWRSGVPHFGKVQYQDVYPGIDLVYYGRQRQLEFDFVVQAGADPRQISLDFEGADGIETDAQGNLIVRIGEGALRQEPPVAYQERDGGRQRVAAAYVVESQLRATFHLGAYDPSRPLVIDPVLVYSTYLGGSDHDFGYGIAVDGHGNAYITGETYSTDFPGTNPIQAGSAGLTEVFVAKLNAAGSALVYSTYLGGSGEDYGRGIAVDASGRASITGFTTSADFPTTNPIQGASAGGGTDAFVAKLNGDGSAIVYSTYLGGGGDDYGLAIAVDGPGNAFITGYTQSTNFPTASAMQATHGGGSVDVFVAKLETTGAALVYSTYLGGSGDEYGYGVAVDGSGNAYLTGYTESSNFPTANPLQGENAGNADAFVVKLNPTGSALVYSTYLGGGSADSGQGIAVDSSGKSAYVTGFTRSANFPTASPIQGAHAGGTHDAFVVRLNQAGSALAYSTYLGGGGSDHGRGVALDDSGNAYVTGHTSSTNFPTASPLQGANAGSSDVFVAKLSPTGSAFVYSTYLGGSSGDYGLGIAVDGLHNAYLTGGTSSTGFPTAHSLQEANAGGAFDIFVAKTGEVDLIFGDGFEVSP